jgi:hypothetical protein
MGHRAETPSWIQRLVASPGVRSGYASAVVHMAALIVLALLWVDERQPPRPRPIVIAMADSTVPDDAAGAAEATAELPGPPAAPHAPAADDAAIATVDVPEPAVQPVEPPTDPQVPIVPNDVEAAASRSVPVRPASLPRPASPAGAGAADPIAAAFAARSGPARGEAARGRGGSAASEAAVDRGLAWLARHQAADGSWRFDLSGCQCDGGCRDAGTVSSTTAATGIALLPFLGAGHTQAAGTYRETVTRGLYYLMSRIQPTPRGGDMAEGTMYGQGVATLALAEALGMTRDDMLVGPVRDAVRFIVTAQDTYGGGWRYLPGQAGDTTVTAWQVAALKSAALAGLEVPSPTFDGVCRFLDRVEAKGGEAYGYQSPQARGCTSAIGLLCRMYTGWDRDEVLDRGLAALAKPGPAPQAIYLNFYLAQALLQRDHPAWPRWNARNRDQLVARQATVGHEAGSWFLADPDTAPGGRLGHTALAVLTLEVYYRLLPIYGHAAVAGF